MEKSYIPLEGLMYSNFIKYDKMSEMVEGTFQGSSAIGVNIFIDIYSLIKNVYRSNINGVNFLALTSGLINLCGHIRWFFSRRYKVSTKIFLINSYNCPEYNTKMWFGYNSKQVKLLESNPNIINLIDKNFKLLNILVPYLYDIYYLETNFEAGVLIHDIMNYNVAQGNIDPNIIITKDPYLYQLPAIKNDTVIFRPYKHEGEDFSYVVNKYNVFTIWGMSNGVKEQNDLQGINPELLTSLMSLSRCTERSISSLISIPTASKLLREGVFGNKILNGYNSNPEFVWNSIIDREDNRFINLSADNYISRFKVIDIPSQYIVYLNTNFDKIKLINLYDTKAVQKINSEYFERYPLDLNKL